MTKIPTFIISLPGDDAHLHATASQLDSDIFDIYRPFAFRGRALPDSVCHKLTRDPNSVNNKGALGCMLSHINVWEHVASLDTPYVLVIEDDVIANNPDRLLHLSVPSDFDLVFCNDRMAIKNDLRGLTFHKHFADTLPTVAARGRSVGADAYLISARGAKELLNRFSVDFYFGHVDVRMLAYSVHNNDISAITGSLADEIRNILRIIQPATPLNSYILSDALFSHVHPADTNSRREREDRLGKIFPLALKRDALD